MIFWKLNPNPTESAGNVTIGLSLNTSSIQGRCKYGIAAWAASQAWLGMGGQGIGVWGVLGLILGGTTSFDSVSFIWDADSTCIFFFFLMNELWRKHFSFNPPTSGSCSRTLLIASPLVFILFSSLSHLEPFCPPS